MKRILILAALCVALTACDMRPWKPSADYGSCLKGHTESGLMMIPNSNGGFTYVPTSDYVCDEYEYPLGDGPAYHADVLRYQRELTEWCARNPGECE